MPVVERRKAVQFQLAKPWDGTKFTSYMIVEPKYDGLRGGVLFHGLKGEAFTRTGLPIPNAAHIVQELAEVAAWAEVNFPGFKEGVFLDGEFLAEDWNLTQSIVKTQEKHEKAQTLKFFVFDFLSAPEWERKESFARLDVRKDRLRRALSYSRYPRFVVETPWIMADMKHARRIMQEYVEEGFEGVMIKTPFRSYVFGRGDAWLKVKPVFDADLTVVGTAEGRGKHKGMLGALKVEGEAEWKGVTHRVSTEVGTGFDDSTRKELWAVRNQLVGKTVQIAFQEVTKDGALRFPVFQRLREDK